MTWSDRSVLAAAALSLIRCRWVRAPGRYTLQARNIRYLPPQLTGSGEIAPRSKILTLHNDYIPRLERLTTLRTGPATINAGQTQRYTGNNPVRKEVLAAAALALWCRCARALGRYSRNRRENSQYPPLLRSRDIGPRSKMQTRQNGRDEFFRGR